MKQVRPINPALKQLEVPAGILNELRSICLRFPEAYEETAWVGARWMIWQKNFAHVLGINAGWPPAYAKAARQNGPVNVLTFRVKGQEAKLPKFNRYPFFRPDWFPDIAGIVIDDEVDWKEIAKLLTISYCVLAPKKLAVLVNPKD